MVAQSVTDGALYHAAWEAICRSQAVIEVALDGTTVCANDAFLATMGYALPEVPGRHHRMFGTREDAASPAYAAFWRKLAGSGFAVVAREGKSLADDIRAATEQAAAMPPDHRGTAIPA